MSGPSGPESSDSDPLKRAPASRADETDIHSRAYSAPESEQFTSAPYVPPDPALYDYDSYSAVAPEDDRPPRWPWVVGVVAIVAAIHCLGLGEILEHENVVAGTEEHRSVDAG